MTSKERELLCSWIVNEESRLHSELVQLRSNLRFRRIDITDCFELAIMQQRYTDFCDFVLVLGQLVELGEVSYYDS